MALPWRRPPLVCIAECVPLRVDTVACALGALRAGGLRVWGPHPRGAACAPVGHALVTGITKTPGPRDTYEVEYEDGHLRVLPGNALLLVEVVL